MTYPDGSQHIVVAGGYLSDTTIIYELNGSLGIWTYGPNKSNYFGASVPYKNTFLAIGGENPYSNQIYEFVADPIAGLEWKLRPEQLKTPKSRIAAFMVPDTYATLC